jgi:hypothetical protein
VAIKFVSLIPSSAVSGAAPDVQSFAAGTRQSDGTYSAVMSLDPMGANLVVGFKAIAPTNRSNFAGIKIAIVPPDSAVPQIATPLCEPFAPDSAGNYVYEGQLTIDPAMLGGSIPASPVALTFIAASVNSAGMVRWAMCDHTSPRQASLHLVSGIYQAWTASWYLYVLWLSSRCCWGMSSNQS